MYRLSDMLTHVIRPLSESLCVLPPPDRLGLTAATSKAGGSGACAGANTDVKRKAAAYRVITVILATGSKVCFGGEIIFARPEPATDIRFAAPCAMSSTAGPL